MSSIRFAGAALVFAVGTLAVNVRAQDTFGDAAAMLQFQRSVDNYAFQHRQVQRRLGEGVDQQALAAALRAARPAPTDGDFFTPVIAAAFRHRITTALRASDCKMAVPATATSEVPRVGVLALGTQAVPSCVLKVLPPLPEELEYRLASVALILLDTHANMVVDVLHGAFPTVRSLYFNGTPLLSTAPP